MDSYPLGLFVVWPGVGERHFWERFIEVLIPIKITKVASGTFEGRLSIDPRLLVEGSTQEEVLTRLHRQVSGFLHRTKSPELVRWVNDFQRNPGETAFLSVGFFTPVEEFFMAILGYSVFVVAAMVLACFSLQIMIVAMGSLDVVVTSERLNLFREHLLWYTYTAAFLAVLGWEFWNHRFFPRLLRRYGEILLSAPPLRVFHAVCFSSLFTVFADKTWRFAPDEVQ